MTLTDDVKALVINGKETRPTYRHIHEAGGCRLRMAGAAQCPNPTHLNVTQGVGVCAALCRAAVARDLAVHESQEASLEVTARTLQGNNNTAGV